MPICMYLLTNKVERDDIKQCCLSQCLVHGNSGYYDAYFGQQSGLIIKAGAAASVL